MTPKPYQILPYTKEKARELGILVYPSDNPKYKIDIYTQDGQFVCSGGNPSYADYPTYIKTHGKEYADNRRRLYRIRHKKEIEKVGSRGWLISKLLW